MSQDGLVPLSLDAFVAFFAFLAVVIGLVLWREHKKKIRRREDYLAQFDTDRLRMSRYRIGLVYRVVAEVDGDVTIVAVWDQGNAVVGGSEEVVTADVLIPFDKDRFA